MTRSKAESHKSLDRAFRITITLNGLDGVQGIAGGIVLLLVPPASIEHLVRIFPAHELAQHPHDFIARHLLHSATGLSCSSTVYGGIYLLSHGMAKVILVVLVLRDKLWAYPLMIALDFRVDCVDPVRLAGRLAYLA